MINFDEELKRFKPMPGVSQAEEEIYSNDLRDISDIVAQMTEDLRSQVDMGQGSVRPARPNRM